MSQPAADATPRASWDEYFMRIAVEVDPRDVRSQARRRGDRADKHDPRDRLQRLGPRPHPHCDEDGHMMEDGHCVRTIHAEANAIIQAARNGVRIEGADIYVTASALAGAASR
jgi:dCMP deaminase